MGQRPNELTPHENLHHYWGAELRALRLVQRLSLTELGHRLHCDPSYLAKIERAERPIPATLALTQRFQDALAQMPGRYRRGRGARLARAALASAGDRQVEHAATLGLDALTIGTETGSARTLTELAHLNDMLNPWQNVPAVADFRAAMKDTVSPKPEQRSSASSAVAHRSADDPSWLNPERQAPSHAE